MSRTSAGRAARAGSLSAAVDMAERHAPDNVLHLSRHAPSRSLSKTTRGKAVRRSAKSEVAFLQTRIQFAGFLQTRIDLFDLRNRASRADFTDKTRRFCTETDAVRLLRLGTHVAALGR